MLPRDLIPKHLSFSPCGLIIYTDEAGDPGTRWVAIILLSNGKGEYDDSFRFPPLYQAILSLMTTNCKNGWTYNNITLQHPFTKRCGYYCIAFLINRFNNKPYLNFINSFLPNIKINEKLLFKH